MQDKFKTQLQEITSHHNEKIKSIQEDFVQKKKELIIKIAKEQNKYSVGDRIKDAVGEIIIIKIAYTLRNGKPTCIYYGYSRKIFTRNIKPTERKIYLEDII